MVTDEFTRRVSDHVAKTLIHLKQASVRIGDGDTEMIFERLPVGVEPFGHCIGGDRVGGVRRAHARNATCGQ
jgi:hypothetical protein